MLNAAASNTTCRNAEFIDTDDDEETTSLIVFEIFIHKGLKMIEKALTCAAFMLLCMQNVPVSGTLLWVAYAACGLFFVLAIYATKKIPDVRIEVVLLALLALLASIWSIKTDATLMYALTLGGASMLGVYINYRYALQDVLLILWVASALSVCPRTS